MCGRYSLTSPVEAMARLFGVAMGEHAPRYNIAPSQGILVARAAPDGAGGAREAAVLRWGLVPSWAKDADIGNRMINARAETVAEKPSFRAAFRRRRCLVPATGFYEWRVASGPKQPYNIGMADGGPFAMAGLWEHWTGPDGAAVETCAILTTEANELLRPIHARMPVILAPGDFDLWLDPELTMPELLAPLLRPFDPAVMVAHPVSRHVNNVRNDDPACLEPVD